MNVWINEMRRLIKLVGISQWVFDFVGFSTRSFMLIDAMERRRRR